MASPASTNDAVVAGYVITDHGEILAQLPDDSEWGFSLADDDQTWPGGFGVAGSWELLDATDPRIDAEVRERLEWILEDYREETATTQRSEVSWNS